MISSANACLGRTPAVSPAPALCVPSGSFSCRLTSASALRPFGKFFVPSHQRQRFASLREVFRAVSPAPSFSCRLTSAEFFVPSHQRRVFRAVSPAPSFSC
ncbi:MAG: hypothetical protein K9J42_05885, partial [Sulfuritalea sp.]|nr:hypothetical protein [Sulfuritalea sp.]